MPYESTRVCLQPIRGVEGSDYINASFLDGYRQQKAYIATQGPLAETTEDFWRMLWEHNSTIVVMLTKLREMGRVSMSLNLENYIKLINLHVFEWFSTLTAETCNSRDKWVSQCYLMTYIWHKLVTFCLNRLQLYDQMDHHILM